MRINQILSISCVCFISAIKQKRMAFRPLTHSLTYTPPLFHTAWIQHLHFYSETVQSGGNLFEMHSSFMTRMLYFWRTNLFRKPKRLYNYNQLAQFCSMFQWKIVYCLGNFHQMVPNRFYQQMPSSDWFETVAFKCKPYGMYWMCFVCYLFVCISWHYDKVNKQERRAAGRWNKIAFRPKMENS